MEPFELQRRGGRDGALAPYPGDLPPFGTVERRRALEALAKIVAYEITPECSSMVVAPRAPEPAAPAIARPGGGVYEAGEEVDLEGEFVYVSGHIGDRGKFYADTGGLEPERPTRYEEGHMLVVGSYPSIDKVILAGGLVLVFRDGQVVVPEPLKLEYFGDKLFVAEGPGTAAFNGALPVYVGDDTPACVSRATCCDRVFRLRRSRDAAAFLPYGDLGLAWREMGLVVDAADAAEIPAMVANASDLAGRRRRLDVAQALFSHRGVAAYVAWKLGRER